MKPHDNKRKAIVAMVLSVASLSAIAIARDTLTGQVAPVCGDRQLSNYEECDDGNGMNGDGCNGQCIVENAPTGLSFSWTAEPSLPTSVREFAATVALGKMWVIGGYNPTGGLSDKVFATSDGKTWSQVSTLPYSVYGASAIEWNGELWVIGGTTCGSQTSCYIHRTLHSVDGVTWLDGPALPGSLNVYKRSLYILGEKLFISSTTIHSLTSAQAQWQVAGSAYGSSTVSFQNKAWMLNGRSVVSSEGASGWQIHSVLPTWLTTQLYVVSPGMLVAHGQYLLAIGNAPAAGATVQQPNCSKAILSSLDGIHWGKSLSSPCWQPMRDHTILSFQDRLWMLGEVFDSGKVYSSDTPSALSVCGNGNVEGSEQCDDGNRTDTDSCDNNCRNRASCPQTAPSCTQGSAAKCCDNQWVCALSGACSCYCSGSTYVQGVGCPNYIENPCEPLAADCGDGVVQNGEQCDDGNTIDTDGCSNACKLSVCGNGIRQGEEQCDDGNVVATDACTALCRNAVCGDRVVRTEVEQCDDGNTVNTDSCTNACRTAICGDGIKRSSEQCDDQNIVAGDGCSALCAVEAGFSCSGETLSTCVRMCGNRTLNAGETCDDGNFTGGDGCSGACKKEFGFTCNGIPSTCTALPQGACLLNRLVSHWKLDEPESVGVQFHPRNHADSHGQISLVEETFDVKNGITPGPGQIGLGLGLANYAGERLRGQSPLLSLDDAQTSGFTFTLWTYPTLRAANQSYVQGIAEKPGEFKIIMTNANFIFTIINGTQTRSVSTPITPVNGTYKYSLLAVWMDPQSQTIGIQTGRSDLQWNPAVTSSWNGGIGSTVQPLKIGAVASQPQYAGHVDSISLWKRVLTSEERAKLFAFGAGLDYPSFGRVCGTSPFCGDVIVQTGEQCDEGAITDTGRCTSHCQLAVCGDGNTRTGNEECDDGNMVNTDTCTNICKRAACGDNFIQAGEECDDGNTVHNDACTKACRNARCGDGVVRTGVEQCDDGNTNLNDGCDPQCRFETTTRERCLANPDNARWDATLGCIPKRNCYEYATQATCPQTATNGRRVPSNQRPCRWSLSAANSFRCMDDMGQIWLQEFITACTQRTQQTCGGRGSDGKLCIWTGSQCTAAAFQDRCINISSITQCTSNALCRFGKERSGASYIGHPYCSEKVT